MDDARVVEGGSGPRTLLVGASAAIGEVSRQLRQSQVDVHIDGAVVTDHGDLPEHLEVRVLGRFDALDQVLAERDVQRVLVTMPVAMAGALKDIAATLAHRGVSWSFMPTLADQLAGRIHPPMAHGAGVELPFDSLALIGRQPRPLDEQAIGATIGDRVVLITGAGGSIGSELARIVGRFSPSRLVLVERSENALFEIDREMRGRFPALQIAAVLHDVTKRQRSAAVITAQKPDVIFHAAAHKHVPMMEDHPAEAVENNFYGTRAMADAAAHNGVDRFVMISSDKAVNPSSVMGATKRLAELYIQHLNQRSDTCFSMVRFGNVLGSACSVIPIWSQQIARGEPVTVTDPRMTRYFMTIPEAAGLVIQSAAFSEQSGAAVFLLDMGEPVRIEDLARRFIQNMGLEPDADIPIIHTGIRPGEKLFEELAYHGEDMLPTPHDSIRLWRTLPPTADHMRHIIRTFDALRRDDDHSWQSATREMILEALREAVPEMSGTPVDD